MARISARFSSSTLWSMARLGLKGDGEGGRCDMGLVPPQDASFAGSAATSGSRSAACVARHVGTAGQHGDQRLRHDQRQGHMHEQEADNGDHAQEVHEARALEVVEEEASSENCTGFQITRPESTCRMTTTMMPM